MNDGKIYIFYDVLSGEVLIREERNRLSIMPTIEEVIEIYPKLHERAPASYNVIELEYGQYAQDFEESNGYRVNPDTKELEFSYPDPNESEAPPVYQKPLSEQIEEVKQHSTMVSADLQAFMDFYFENGGI